MTLTDNTLRLIAADAMVLAERLALPAAAPMAADPQAAVRLDAWALRLGGKGARRLDARLGTLGHDRASILPVLGALDPTFVATMPLPDWALRLAEWATALAAGKLDPDADGTDVLALSAQDPVPFADLLAPFVRYADARLAAEVPKAIARLAPGARHDLRDNLLVLLSTVWASSAFAEFQLWRGGRRSKGPGADAAYQDFCRWFLSGGHAAFFRDHAYLARRTMRFIDTYISVNARFLSRLQADADQIADRFFGLGALPQVARLAPGLSDRHEGGATVIIVTLQDGKKVVYKPKSIDSEAWFDDLVTAADQLATGLPALAPNGPAPLPRTGYGWVGFVADEACRDLSGVRDYYHRAGALLALTHIIGGYDFHEENVIAAGSCPRLVDFETLFNPDAAGPFGPDERVFSVLNTALLPHWMNGTGGRTVDISGFAGWAEDAPQEVAVYLDLNTDVMRPGKTQRRGFVSRNMPMLNGAPCRMDAHLDDLLHGFRTMTASFAQAARRGDSPLNPVLARADNLVFRHILRNTRIYVGLLEASYAPAANRSGIDASLLYESLARPLSDNPTPAGTALVAAEIAALTGEDVPVFLRHNANPGLMTGGQATHPEFFGATGMQTYQRHFDLLGPDETAKQERLIAASVFARAVMPEALDLVSDRATWDRVGPAADPVALARVLADEIMSDATTVSDGRMHWNGVAPAPGFGRYAAGLLDGHLYQGSGGIALFLAALEQALPGHGYGAAALGALPVRARDFDHRTSTGTAGLELGGYSGLGSAIYAHLTVGQMLDAADPVDCALRLARLIDPQEVRVAALPDVMGGVAGLILSLLALEAATGEAPVLIAAAAAADRLIEMAETPAAGQLAWVTMEDKRLTGFAHGAGGIAVALVRLGLRLGRADLIEAGRAALTYEEAQYDPETGNWRDLRFNTPTCSCQWCHGAVGIGCTHMALRQAGAPLDTDLSLARAIAAVENRPPATVDHLCCGNAGRLLFLTGAGDAGADGAGALLAYLTTGRRGGRDFTCYPSATGLTVAPPMHPGLMQGTAGIGFALIRAARPDLRLPQPLTLS